ncbi:MAG: hypothetical protein JNM94_19015 [Phycisphaerae bacterium]|nr:hypothetical protein [Phycisphaerae bacterium]
MRHFRSNSLVLAGLVVTSGAIAGPTFEEVPDAGSTPGTAQPTGGPSGAPMARIRGELTATADAVDFEDVYVICITDPAAFKATVNAPGTDFDTRLSLFTLNGFGLLSNDNDPFNFPTTSSHLQQPATDATGQTIPGPGLYLLAISSKANKPGSVGGLIFNDASINGTEISGPDGPGGGQPLAGWTQADGTVGGKYVIDLEGVKFLDLPCNVECPDGALLDADLGDCANDGSDVNGGCGSYGEGVQTIGTLSPTGYVAVCGNGGRYAPGSFADVDTFRFHLNAPSYVSASLVMRTPGGDPVLGATLRLTQGDDCATLVTAWESSGGACSTNSGPVALPAGDHTVIVSVAANAAAPCPTNYILWLGVTESPNPLCGLGGIESCAIPHLLPGCSDLACCDAVCGIDPTCCDSTWDNACANAALAVCLDVAYTCAGGAVPNDCVANAQPIAPGASVSFTTTLATTDGPTSDAGDCSGGKDVWFRVTSPVDGKMHVSLCAGTTFDSTLAVYRLPADGDIDPTQVFNGRRLLGCNDEGCAPAGSGPSALDVAVQANRDYVIRVGGRVTAGIPASGTGTIEVRFSEVVYATGPTYPVLFDPSNGGALVATNLGFASGKVSLAQPERWLAQAFTVPAGPNGAGYLVTEVLAAGTASAGATNSTLQYIVWNRRGTAKPVDGDQRASGAVPFPIPFDDPSGSPANETHRIAVDPPLPLEPGDYWLTVYAGNEEPPNVPASFSWFASAPNGINVLDRNRKPFAWRSVSFPLPGFNAFSLPSTTLKQIPIADPLDLYNTGFTICGLPNDRACNADLNGDDVINGGDLAILLGAWGTPGPGDVDGTGVVDGADLALMLGSWGPC